MTTCNSTLDEMRIGTSEIPIAGPLTFHELAVIIAGSTTLLAIVISFYLIYMHATHYTKPAEQKYIIRILLMVPIYATSNFLQLKFYWHAIYFSVMSDCWEAFAISSFFALLCQYMAPDLHDQKEFFRDLSPVKPWVWPINWFKKCCGGERGPWRTPASGLTWFNIIWIGIYHYCFIRVAMTITAVLTQYYGLYCESSNSPVFSHIWCTVLNSVAVTIAMYCVIQFYVQLKTELAPHSPLLKVAAIKLVIFLCFWQSSAISIGTSTLDLIQVNPVLAYPDIKVGLSALLLCVEMVIFAIMHLWAFPWQPYREAAPPIFYPEPTANSSKPPRENVHCKPCGGPLGIKALFDAVNVWDVLKAFVRGMRWLFVGVRRRHQDPSYRKNLAMDVDMDDKNADTSYPMRPYALNPGIKSTDHLPIASEFRKSQFGLTGMNEHAGGRGAISPIPEAQEEGAALIKHAQGDPSSRVSSPLSYTSDGRSPEQYRRERQESDLGYRGAQPTPERYQEGYDQDQRGDMGYRGGPPQHQAYNPRQEQHAYQPPTASSPTDDYWEGTSSQPAARQPPSRSSTQIKFGEALWGPNPHGGAPPGR